MYTRGLTVEMVSASMSLAVRAVHARNRKIICFLFISAHLLFLPHRRFLANDIECCARSRMLADLRMYRSIAHQTDDGQNDDHSEEE